MNIMEEKMFKVIDLCGDVHEAYGTFIDADGDVQFILCNSNGEFYRTDSIKGYYKLYDAKKTKNNE